MVKIPPPPPPKPYLLDPEADMIVHNTSKYSKLSELLEFSSNWQTLQRKFTIFIKLFKNKFLMFIIFTHPA
jgi:hypothetical protein